MARFALSPRKLPQNIDLSWKVVSTYFYKMIYFGVYYIYTGIVLICCVFNRILNPDFLTHIFQTGFI